MWPRMYTEDKVPSEKIDQVGYFSWRWGGNLDVCIRYLNEDPRTDPTIKTFAGDPLVLRGQTRWDMPTILDDSAEVICFKAAETGIDIRVLMP